MRSLKSLLIVVVAVIISIGMASYASAQVYANDEAGIRDEWRRNLRAWHRSENERARILDQKERDLNAREQGQQYYAPPAVVYSAPAPNWGYRYYRYYDPSLSDWAFASVWCPFGWVPPIGWFAVNTFDRHHFRHFAHGRVNGGRLMMNHGSHAGTRGWRR